MAPLLWTILFALSLPIASTTGCVQGRTNTGSHKTVLWMQVTFQQFSVQG